MTLSVGATLGRYEIRSQLGAGGMGEVYLAWDSRLKAEAAARRALEQDDNLAEAHGAMAAVKVYKWEWTAAEQEYKRAVELNPNFVGHVDYLSIRGQNEQAIALAKRAREQNPLMIEANLSVGARAPILRPPLR